MADPDTITGRSWTGTSRSLPASSLTRAERDAAAVSQFVASLPSSNPDNFQKWGGDSHQKQNITRRPLAYVPVKDYPAQQVIVTEKTNILLRYLHQQFKKNKPVPKRENAATPSEEDNQRKRQRFE